MQIQDSTFIITGGASGLGEATARHFHHLGANVVIADIGVERGQSLAAALGSRAAFARTDVSSESDATAAIELATSRYGRLNGVINCAGIGNACKVLGKEGPHRLPDFLKVINVNLIGSFNMLRLGAAAMSTAKPSADGERGVIVNTASIAAYEGQIGQVAYSASKAGIIGMALPAARELARFGIRVNTIAPGLFLTPLMATLPAEVQESLGKSTPFPQRLGQPIEYARLAAHIVENVMINGEAIRLDGAVRLAAK
ncbi:MAG TPA: SDR family NAD(P)-dependent oxidoreductase [Burkholderiaceae bacterium]|nr:SDR family NAD(P)-dependent oxidoreductase [Burkholderiaceae bacterium]